MKLGKKVVFALLSTAMLCVSALASDAGVFADKYEITEDEGVAVVRPYVKTANGSEITNIKDVKWALDSVNVFPEVKEDGSLVLKAKINGKIKVTGYINYNGETYEESCEINITGQKTRFAQRKIKLLAYGNSILKHGPSESLGWTGNHGMAASSEEKDYIHRLIFYLEKKYGAGSVEWVHGEHSGGFESGSSAYEEDEDLSYAFSALKKESEEVMPDVVTVQYGENSNCTNAAAYENGLTQFVNTIKSASPDAVVLITTPFWGGSAKINDAKNTPKKLNSPRADLAPLTKAENQAFDHPEWSHGVQVHPGDAGMEKIAKEMFKQLNMYLTANEKTTYSPFCDMSDYEWAGNSVEKLYEKGVVSGRGDGVFDPSAAVAREEFTKMLVIAANIEGNENLKPNFDDVDPDAWCYPYVSAAFDKKIVKGVSEEHFGIGENILRQDMAVMIYRILKEKGIASEAETDSLFADFDGVSDYAKEAVIFLENAKLVSGNQDGKINPEAFLTRAEAAVAINRMIEYIEQ